LVTKDGLIFTTLGVGIIGHIYPHRRGHANA